MNTIPATHNMVTPPKCRPRWLSALVLLLAVSLPGCQSDEAPPPEPGPTQQASQPAEPPPPPDPAIRWKELLGEAEAHLAATRLQEAEDVLATLDVDTDRFADAEQARFNALRSGIKQKREEQANQQRIANLEKAGQLLADGELDEARRAADRVLDSAPTPEQRAAAGQIKTKIEEQYTARRKLQTAMKLLASKSRAQVRDAREQLWNDIEAAFPLLIEASRSDNPVLVGNTLEMLRLLNQPHRTIPIMVAVLSRAEQEASWPDAIKELGKLDQPGAGPALLKLAVEAELPQQRVAALTALSSVVDPPRQTMVALLPMLHADGAELTAALETARHAAQVHHQTDLVARRGLDGVPVSAEQEQLWASLPERLLSLASAGKDEQPRTPQATAALQLGIATRQIAPRVFEGVTISRVTREDPSSPGKAALDGVWNATTPETMWRYPVADRVQIVFDLGEVKTVTGVRIWNYNEPNVSYRGWKEVDVFVSSSPALLTPVSSGIVAPAPGAADRPDYSVTLPVPFVEGRYIKLQANSLWRTDSYSGLAEVQILGF